MRQVLQDIRSGEISVEDVPAPAPPTGSLLVATRCSLISPGTERAIMELGSKSLAAKARARPEVARKVLDSVREDGVQAAYRKVLSRLDHPNPLGYSSCGVVVEAPDDAPAGPGELVACAGAGYATHAEVVAVPRNLCARVPEGVAPEDAAYGTTATIALHGVRLCSVGLGDVVAVVGLGLVGQLTLDLLRAAGCVALGVDPDPGRVELAREAGFFATTDADELEGACRRRSDGRGADAAIVTAASDDPRPLATAIGAARARATICIVGAVPVESPREPLFAKEVRLVVSRSYGPGRYDPAYEERGVDYPAEYVRWTAGRNLGEVVRLMASGALRPSRLTTHTFDIAEAADAYALLAGDEPSMGIVLRYPDAPPPRTGAVEVATRRVGHRIRRRGRSRPRIGVIGAGTFARSVLLPALAGRAEIATIVNATGYSARASAERFGARTAATDPAVAFDDDELDAIVIATRHDTHAEYAARALAAGKHVFVEKPLALDERELATVVEAASSADAPTLTVGFNRRFAPLAVKVRDAVRGLGPLLLQYRVNAGRVPRAHWVHDPTVGGGRIVGEVCHFVDLATYVCGETPRSVTATAVEGSLDPREDTIAATLGFPGGSVATIAYSALGAPALAKERIEVLADGCAAVIDDFRELRLYRGGEEATERGRRDKGHANEIAAFVTACRTGEPAQALEECAGVMRATFAIRDAIGGTYAADGSAPS